MYIHMYYICIICGSRILSFEALCILDTLVNLGQPDLPSGRPPENAIRISINTYICTCTYIDEKRGRELRSMYNTRIVLFMTSNQSNNNSATYRDTGAYYSARDIQST